MEFIWHLNNLEDGTLAKAVLEVQKEYCMPGLFTECSEWIRDSSLPNIMVEKLTKPQWKKCVKTAILKEKEEDQNKMKCQHLKN